jgi:hypothetical protein
MKFGPHGGAHGHFDKLNFVMYSHGQMLAVDPGTHPYGIPIHREWDSMTIAHNTISVDQQRQTATTGKLLDWQVGEDWVAVRAAAGDVYPAARLQRTILLTSNYVLIADRCESADGQPHSYDWAYHNVGTEFVVSPLKVEPYTLTPQNGYQHLSNTMHGATSDAIAVRFVSIPRTTNSESESNSTPATYYSTKPLPPKPSTPGAKIEVNLQMLPVAKSEVITGQAPSKSSQSPVPFVIVRRSGTSASFEALITVRDEGITNRQHLRFEHNISGRYSIDGPHFSDTFSDNEKLDVHHYAK